MKRKKLLLISLSLFFFLNNSFSQGYDDIRIWKGGEAQIASEYVMFPYSLYQEIEKRNLDIYSIIPSDNDIVDVCDFMREAGYGDELQENIDEDSFFEEIGGPIELEIYLTYLYRKGKGFGVSSKNPGWESYDEWNEVRFDEKVISDIILLEEYVKENFSYGQILSWFWYCKEFYNVLIENLDLWLFIDQL